VSDFIGEYCYFTNQNTITNELHVTFVSFGVIVYPAIIAVNLSQ
jgi:hypothetical protein